MKLRSYAQAVVLLAAIYGPSAASAREPLPEALYRNAAKVMPERMVAAARNLRVEPVWLEDGRSFWYRRDTAGGPQWIAVDPVAAKTAPAFDAARLTTAIAAATGQPAGPASLMLESLSVRGSPAREFTFSIPKRRVTCRLDTYACESAPAPDPFASRSPDGRYAVFARDHDLWVRDANGADRRLTRTGEPNFAFGKWPEAGLLRVLTATRGLPTPLFGLSWSPDSRHLLVLRIDERALTEYPFLQSVPYDGTRRPKVVGVRVALASENASPRTEVSMIDVATGDVRVVSTGGPGVSPFPRWSPTGDRCLTLEGGNGSRRVRVLEIRTDGSSRAVVTEESDTMLSVAPYWYDDAALRFLPETNELVWYSQRDGWGHFYLVDVGTGRVKREITRGPWTVVNLLRIDPRTRRMLFTAAGVDPGANPYHRALYSIGLDGGPMRRITAEPGDHDLPGRGDPGGASILEALGLPAHPDAEFISPDGGWFVDTVSTVATPPVTTLRRIDGRTVMTLESADVADLMAAGFQVPKPFTAKAADGTTDLHGVLILPPGFDPSKRYPVIDSIYNGPQVVSTPHKFADALSPRGAAGAAQAFAQLGFVIVIVDSRGTLLRSKAFHDYMPRNFGDFGLSDHVAVLKQLGERHAFMDMSRVGIFGHSFGGYAAMKGIIDFPDVFAAASSSGGPYDWNSMYDIGALLPEPVYSDGSHRPKDARDMPINWPGVDLTQRASQLKGRLQIAYSDLDENAYPANALRMVSALIAANKEFDLVVMPNRTHSFVNEPYFVRRRWDFFVRALLDAEPPRDFRP